MLLAADVGGTNARLALFSPEGTDVAVEDRFGSKEHPSFEAVMEAFFAKHGIDKGTITAACVGVAGPVIDGRCEGTNFPWVIDERDVARELGIPRARARLLNDLQSLAMGALTVPREELVLLHGDAPPRTQGANLAIVAAGTGLGQGMLLWDGDRHLPCATEGGHVGYAPRDELEMELLRYLSAKFDGHVSCERVLSGPGLGNVYDFFRDVKGIDEASHARAAIDRADDRNAAITQYGLSGASGPAARAVALFIGTYGSVAGNLALSSLAVGGIFVAGSIAATMAHGLVEHGFVASFLDKGRMRPLLEKIPVALVTDSKIGLYGSALFAASRLT